MKALLIAIGGLVVIVVSAKLLGIKIDMENWKQDVFFVELILTGGLIAWAGHKA